MIAFIWLYMNEAVNDVRKAETREMLAAGR